MNAIAELTYSPQPLQYMGRYGVHHILALS